jgi:hypothetical protein
MPPPIVCFADFEYPKSCESWAVVPVVLAAVKNASGTSPEFWCVNLAETALDALARCSVILGLETRLMTWIRPSSFVAGPAYNASWGLKALVDSEPSAAVHGWDFLKPFTWGVWLVFGMCAIAACCSQLLMRWLDIRRRKTSPDAVLVTDETVRDVALASFTSLIGSSRLFEFYEGPYMRHVTSMIMAVFSVFIMSLYSSNLTAFSFPESATTTVRSLTGAREYAVHWGFADYARRGMASVLMNTDSTIREVSIAGDERNVIAPDVWLECTADRRLLDVFPMVIVYEIMYNLATYDWIAETSFAIATNVSKIRSISCEPEPTSQRLGLANVWGVFVIAGIGFVSAVACRATLAFRGGKPMFGKNFRWLDPRTPVLNSDGELQAPDLSRRCDDVPSIDMFARLESSVERRRRASIDNGVFSV